MAVWMSLIVLAPLIARAQSNYLDLIGPPQTGAMAPVEMGYVNLSNGDLHVEVPLGTFAQRGGLGYSAKLAYDSRIWTKVNSSPVFLPIYSPINPLGGFPTTNSNGWRLVISGDAAMSVPNWMGQFQLCDSNFYPWGAGWGLNTGFSWQDAEGTVHSFDPNMQTSTMSPPGLANCSPYGDNPDASGYATDGSGLYMVVHNYTDMTVYDRNGNQLYPVLKDTNGNYFSLDASNNIVDTLGRTPLQVRTAPNTIYYDVLNPLGSRSTYTITTATIPVSVPGYSGTLTVVQSITLPNNSVYTFGYDSGTSGDNWGLINYVKLPAGGEITYGYQTFTDASGNIDNTNRWVTSKTAAGVTWHYNPLVTGTGTQQNALIKPSGDQIVYKSHIDCLGMGFLNKERDYYAASGALLKQELIDYVSEGTCSTGQPGPTGSPNMGVARFTSVTYGPSGALTTKAEYDYTNSPSSDSPTKISEWNSYTGTAPATPDRIRNVVYSLTGNPTLAAAHIIGKPISVTVTDGAGTQIAQATYTYDNYSGNPLVPTNGCLTTSASQPSPAAPQHDYQAYCTSNSVRGNLTQVSKWLNTSSTSITATTNSYDDTGNAVQTKDAKSNATSFEFSPSFGRAYVTKITDPLGHFSTKNYDFNSGLLIADTDPNNQATRYTYDGMGRPKTVSYPDGGQITTDYTDTAPISVRTTQLATPDPSIVKTVTVDGYGRLSSQCLGDPEGDTCTETAYDPNGRVHSKTNPHRAVAAASDGTTYFGYDGLDRTSSVTEPDGNVFTTGYDIQTAPVKGQTVTATDETLKQGRTVIDGFGRLVEADEPGDAFAGSASGGTLALNGTLRSTVTGGSPATQATGSVTIWGAEQSFFIDPNLGGCPPPPMICVVSNAEVMMHPPELSEAFDFIFDSGTISVAVNGHTDQTVFGQGDTAGSIASRLAGVIRTSSPYVDYTSVVTNSTNPPSATINLVSRTAGSTTNYPLATAYTYDNFDFASPSFTTTKSGNNLGGGADAAGGTTVYDSGTVTVTVGGTGFTASAPYSQAGNSTTALVAAALVSTGATGLNRSGSPVHATASGANITLTYNTVGVAGNIGITGTSSPSNASLFPGGSFNGSTTLAGGADPYPSGLAHPYVTLYAYDLLDDLTCIEQHGNITGTGCSPAVLSAGSQPPASDATSPWRVRRFEYDSMARMLLESSPEAGVTTMSYSTATGLCSGDLNMPCSQTDARGVSVTLAYDQLNRTKTKTYSDGTPTVTYGYDTGCCGVTPINGIGRMTNSFAGNTELVFQYDPMGRISYQADCPPSGIARGFCYSISALYNAAGQTRSLTYPDGRTVTTNYNAAGRMIKVNLAAFGGTAVNVPYYTVPQTTLASTWGYLPSGAMNRGTYGNGVVETKGYNPRLQLNSMSDAKSAQVLLSKAYGLYDGSGHNNGNILSIVDGTSSSKNQTYGYDTLNRIASGAQADNAFSVTFWYDAWGNMTETGTSNFLPVYDVRNRIQGAPANCTSTTVYCYDPAGELLNDSFHTYAYDAEHRMKTVDGGTTASYTYNPEGKRVRKDTGTVSTEFFYFDGQVIAELNPISGAFTDYILGYGRIAKDGSSNGSGAQYLHADQVQSTRLVTDSAGNVVWQANYNPFGQELAPQNSGVRFQFGGMEYDAETSLNHTEFRQYASAEGRWLTPDPYHGSLELAFPQSLNRYQYVNNNPLRANDPKGEVMGCDPEQPICDPDSGLLEELQLTEDLFMDPLNTVLASKVDPATGLTVGSYNGEPNCQPDGRCAYWNEATQQWEETPPAGSKPPRGNPPPPDPFDWMAAWYNQQRLNYMNELTRVPTNQDYMQAIHNSFATFPEVCGASATGALGNQGKADTASVSTTPGGGVKVEVNAPEPSSFRSYTVLGVGVEVLGKSWHSISGVRAGIRSKHIPAGAYATVNIASAYTCPTK